MPLTVAVLVASDAFRDVWEGLVREAGADAVRLATDLGALAPLGAHAALVVAAGGAEGRARGTVESLRELPLPPTAVVGAEADHHLAVALVKAGADAYFALPGDLPDLRGWLEEHVQRVRARGAAARLAEREAERYDFGGFIGESPGLRRSLERVARVIPRDRTTVLVTGETGTGKELVALALHHNGPRRSGPFVEVNCAALPATLLESELFGYEKGAFTDARTSKPGLFEAAHGGTLFLDEIGDLPLVLQVKVLKVLEDKTIRRLGALKSVRVDVRLVAATHVDLARAVREGNFRQDLFYRLNVVPVHLPPLRERGEDVLLLARHFLARFAEEYELPLPRVDEALRRALLRHDWPGNVRELRNSVERALLLGDGHLRPEDLLIAAPGPGSTVTSALPFPASLRVIERAAALAALELESGNKSAAAELLGISRTRLYRLLQSDGSADV